MYNDSPAFLKFNPVLVNPQCDQENKLGEGSFIRYDGCIIVHLLDFGHLTVTD